MHKFAALCAIVVLLAWGPASQAFAAAGALTWAAKAGMPTARCCLDLVSYSDGRLYAIGGGGEGNVLPVLNTVEAYNPSTNTWHPRASMPTARNFAGATVGVDGNIYVVGGFTLGGYLATVEAYNPTTNTWTTRRSMSAPRGGLGLAATSNGKLYAVGGYDGQNWLATVEEYDPLADTWTQRQPMLTSREHFGFNSGPDGRLYAIGGGNGGLLASGEAYNTTTDQWAALASMPTARWAFGFTLGPNRKFYVIGGNGGGGAGGGNLNTVLEYDPTQNVWSSQMSMPTARQALAAATGRKGAMYAIGGSIGVPEQGSGENEQALIARH